MKVINKLVDIANNGVNEYIQYFRYYNRNAHQFNCCMLSLDNLIYKLNNGELDINDEIKIIDEEKHEKIEKIDLQKGIKSELYELASKLNEIIDYINKGEE